MAAPKKNKTVTVALLLSVIIVWGLVFYNVIRSISVRNKPVQITSKRNKAPLDVTTETYILTNNDRDPFLSILSDTSIAIDSSFAPSATVPPKKKVIYKTPIYCGVIKNGENTTAIIKINSTYHNLSSKYKDDTIQIINFTDTSLTLIYHDEKLILYR